MYIRGKWKGQWLAHFASKGAGKENRIRIYRIKLISIFHNTLTSAGILLLSSSSCPETAVLLKLFTCRYYSKDQPGGCAPSLPACLLICPKQSDVDPVLCFRATSPARAQSFIHPSLIKQCHHPTEPDPLSGKSSQRTKIQQLRFRPPLMNRHSVTTFRCFQSDFGPPHSWLWHHTTDRHAAGQQWPQQLMEKRSKKRTISSP